jgi:hypothetical protein
MKLRHYIKYVLLWTYFWVGLMGLSTLTASQSAYTWQFDVFVDDRYIGEHVFALSPEGDQWVLETQARFEVKILFFTAFRYEHDNTEIWDDRGLVSIAAQTDANGKEFIVEGERGSGVFRIATQDGENRLPEQIQTFAYWNPSILEANQLLNSQTGEYLPVKVSKGETEILQVESQDIEARQFNLELEQGPITLWYSTTDQRWIALESLTEGGKRLRYVPKSIPDSFDVTILPSFQRG